MSINQQALNVKGSARYDFEIIANWVTPQTKVLDLGCGDGTLPKLAGFDDARH